MPLPYLLSRLVVVVHDSGENKNKIGVYFFSGSLRDFKFDVDNGSLKVSGPNGLNIVFANWDKVNYRLYFEDRTEVIARKDLAELINR